MLVKESSYNKHVLEIKCENGKATLALDREREIGYFSYNQGLKDSIKNNLLENSEEFIQRIHNTGIDAGAAQTLIDQIIDQL